MTDSQPPQKKSIGQRLAGGFAWSTLGAIGWKGLTAASSILVARILGPAGFGELGIVRATANLFTVYAGFRLGTTATKHLAEFKESDPDRAGRILRMSLVMSAVFCGITAAILVLGGPFIAARWLDNAGLALPLQIAGAFLFFQAYSSMRETVLIGTENFKAFARVQTVKGLTTALLIVPGAYFYGVAGAVAGLALAAFLSFLVLRVYIRRALAEVEVNEQVPYAVWKGELPLLWTFALPGLFVGIVTAAVLWWGRTVLAGTEDGYVQLGLFEAGNQWRTLVLFMPEILSRVAMPILAETYGKADKDNFLEATAMQYRAILIVSLPLSVVVIAFADYLMMIFGDAFANSGAILPLLMASVFIYALNQALRKVQDGSGKRWQNFALQVVWAIGFVAALLLPTGPVDAERLAWAFLASEAVMYFGQLLYVEFGIARGTIRRIAASTLLAALAIGLAITAQAGVLTGWQPLALGALALVLSGLPGLWLGGNFALKLLRRRRA
ncbi:oligosaccharide flippase family protein [Aurantiacibacter sp. MUD11]|uniref:oligosaccharide flippase family protein n=1 Tax=Aurantiacibacter sp. MUD11 TaxID=3003265 RepID=UPI0022AADBDE|nr:oligosaccharide flippase family protein [Aurantiacibacter sp. MUD11]WAT17574.1 oligosaccharide flippase family protein [Aurantiacibacter sp. MUD11]